MESPGPCCVFSSVLDCTKENVLANSPLTLARKEKVKECSSKRGDNFYETLNLATDLYYHVNCYNTYTSNNHIERYLKRKLRNQAVEVSVKRSKRLSTNSFNFKLK